MFTGNVETFTPQPQHKRSIPYCYVQLRNCQKEKGGEGKALGSVLHVCFFLEKKKKKSQKSGALPRSGNSQATKRGTKFSRPRETANVLVTICILDWINRQRLPKRTESASPGLWHLWQLSSAVIALAGSSASAYLMQKTVLRATNTTVKCNETEDSLVTVTSNSSQPHIGGRFFCRVHSQSSWWFEALWFQCLRRRVEQISGN